MVTYSTFRNNYICINFTVRIYRRMHMHDLAVDICLSACLSNAWIVAKRYNLLAKFLYHIIDPFIQFSDRKNGWWGTTPCT